MPEVEPLPPFKTDTVQALLEAGQFYFIDETVSFVLYGVVLCLTIKYLARAFSGTLGREKPWQVLSVILIFGLQSSTSVMDLVRFIQNYAIHYGDFDFNNAYAVRKLVRVSWFVDLANTTVASFLSLERIHAFARRLTLGDKAALWTRNTYVKGMLLLEALSLLTGVMTYTSVLKAPTYIDIIEAIQVPNNFPNFLAFQVISNFLRLGMIGFQAVQITIDFRRVRRINTTTNPVTRATQEVLDAMFAVHCRNWVILSCTHVVIIAAVLNARTAMGGRPCASVSAVYSFCFLSQILQPQSVRRRQIMETGHDIMPSLRSERPTAKKQLYGLLNGRKKKHRPLVTSSSSSSLPRPVARRRDSFGFFSMLRGDGDRSRRPSAFVEDGVMKSLHMVSYLETPAAFGLSMEGKDEDKKDENSEGNREEEEDGLGSSSGNDWTSRNRKMSIGNSVWIETSGQRRRLSHNDHYRSASPSDLRAPSPIPLRLRPSLFSGSQNSSRPFTWTNENSLSSTRTLGTSVPALASTATGARKGHRKSRSKSMSEAPVAKVAFLDSFPTHSIITRSHGAFDPEEIELLSPFLDTETQPVPSPLSNTSHPS